MIYLLTSPPNEFFAAAKWQRESFIPLYRTYLYRAKNLFVDYPFPLANKRRGRHSSFFSGDFPCQFPRGARARAKQPTACIKGRILYNTTRGIAAIISDRIQRVERETRRETLVRRDGL